MPQAIPSETGFGARLRHERERRKISLSTIAASTKISAALLDGLEREDLSRWPSGIFRRSFVRAYAQAIGLDPDAVVVEFLERFPDPDDPSASLADDEAAVGQPDAFVPPVADVRQSAAALAARSADTLRAARAFGERWARLVAERAAGVVNARSAKAIGRSAKAFALRDAPVLRLRIVEAVRTFRGGAVLSDTRRRWAAAAWDAGVLIAFALVLFVVVNSFWKPFGVLTLTYYVGGILVLGNTPGVCLFADRGGG